MVVGTGLDGMLPLSVTIFPHNQQHSETQLCAEDDREHNFLCLKNNQKSADIKPTQKPYLYNAAIKGLDQVTNILCITVQ